MARAAQLFLQVNEQVDLLTFSNKHCSLTRAEPRKLPMKGQVN